MPTTLLHKLTRPASAPFRVGASSPYPAGYPGTAGGGASTSAPGFPSPFDHRHSLVGSSCARRRIGLPHGQPTRHKHGPGRRRGCHVPHETDTTGEGALCTPGTVVRSRPAKPARAAPVASQRPAPTSRWNNPSSESADDEASTRVHAIHPSGLPQPVATGWNSGPWAFPRASHPAVTRDARRGRDGPLRTGPTLRLRHQPNLLRQSVTGLMRPRVARPCSTMSPMSG